MLASKQAIWFKNCEIGEGTKRQAQRFRHEKQQSQAEFKNILEKSCIEKDTAMGVKLLEMTLSQPTAATPPTGDKMYNPRFPPPLIYYPVSLVHSGCTSNQLLSLHQTSLHLSVL